MKIYLYVQSIVWQTVLILIQLLLLLLLIPLRAAPLQLTMFRHLLKDPLQLSKVCHLTEDPLQLSKLCQLPMTSLQSTKRCQLPTAPLQLTKHRHHKRMNPNHHKKPTLTIFLVLIKKQYLCMLLRVIYFSFNTSLVSISHYYSYSCFILYYYNKKKQKCIPYDQMLKRCFHFQSGLR